ncbi:MAG: hypothetical protein WBO23_08545 [Burkholderiales bacterium]
MDLDKLITQFGNDLEWFFFYSKYCAGQNLESAFCRDFKWWALGASALVAALVLWWVGGRVFAICRDWARRRALAKVADAETMSRHAWSGYTPDAATSADQRAAKSRAADRKGGPGGNRQ